MSEEVIRPGGTEAQTGSWKDWQGRRSQGWTAKAAYEFAGRRAQLFKEALTEYPNARRDDFSLMRRHLAPRPGEQVLGFGEGSGYFCRAIADAIGPEGRYVITEPSPELLCNLPESLLALPQVFTEVVPVEKLSFPSESFDKVWACGAFHHCSDQTRAIAALYRSLKVGGRMVIFDIFHGTAMARHFDSFVARYCETGHEVKFMSEEFARTLCFLAGFQESQVKIVEVPHRLCFPTERDMGKFIYKLHALTLLPGTEEDRISATLESLKSYLPVEREGDQVVLHFDQRGLIATK
jgi:SAM-dependent methyltransferase